MTTDSGRNADPDPSGGAVGDLEPDELYTLVHSAVRDALLDVLGTVLLLGLALLFVAAGAQLLVTDSSSGAALGVGAIVVGFGIAASALGIGPSIRD